MSGALSQTCFANNMVISRKVTLMNASEYTREPMTKTRTKTMLVKSKHKAIVPSHIESITKLSSNMLWLAPEGRL